MQITHHMHYSAVLDIILFLSVVFIHSTSIYELINYGAQCQIYDLISD